MEAEPNTTRKSKSPTRLKGLKKLNLSKNENAFMSQLINLLDCHNLGVVEPTYVTKVILPRDVRSLRLLHAVFLARESLHLNSEL
jgi:hypothetical protein